MVLYVHNLEQNLVRYSIFLCMHAIHTGRHSERGLVKSLEPATCEQRQGPTPTFDDCLQQLEKPLFATQGILCTMHVHVSKDLPYMIILH